MDTDLHESEAAFEAQFHKAYLDKQSENDAAKSLAASEDEVILQSLYSNPPRRPMFFS